MSTSIPVVRVNHLSGPVAVLEQIGAPVERLFDREGLPWLALGDQQAFVPSERVYGFLARASELESIHDLGIQCGRWFPVGADPWTRSALRGASTLRDALEKLVMLARQESNKMHFVLRRFRGEVWLEYVGSWDITCPGADLAEQNILAVCVSFVEHAIGRPWQPALVKLQTPDSTVLEPMFAGASIETAAPRTLLQIPHSLLDLPVRSTPDALPPTSPEPRALEFPDDLRQILVAYLSEGLPGIGSAAELAGVSVRSFQRELRGAGLTYRALTDQVRRERACQLIRDPRVRLIEVASSVGYSDSAHFSRAFVRWVGMTPSEYRRYSLTA